MRRNFKSQFQSINEFTILSPPDPTKLNLGHGSYGVVKLAEHQKNNNKYALKIVDCKKLHSSTETEIIQREIKIHSQVDHPNIVKFHGTFQENETITMVLEYAENGNLYNYLKKQRKLSESEAFVYFYQTLKAIDYLHKKDFLHRDIKPENLLLDSNYCIKLCDFGWSTEGIKLKRNTFCGTYEYMSPEVVFKKLYNENIDIWSMGVLLYELLHGRSAFKAKNLNEISMKLRRPIDLLFDGGLSEEAKDLIKGILKNDPSERLSLKQIFEHKWVKKMYVSVDFDNYKHKNITDNLLKPFLKEITKPENQEKNYQNYCKKNKYVSENEERPFQPMAKEKENYKENKTLFSFQALDYGRVSSKVNKALSSFEKENNPNYTKSKIFDLQMKKKSPDRILKSMENLAPAFEIKLRKEKELSTAIPNKKNMHEIK